MANKKQPLAFMSYVRFDDKHEAGRLTEFRERLSAEVRMQTGEDFPIFQDRNDIKWGQNWKERIEEGLDEATFLMAIITPSFFNSPTCRDEVERFMERERKLKRNDLILPVYYVACPVVDEEEKRAGHELAQAIAAHQYADWQDLRFEPFTSPTVGRRLASLAIQIREALERTEGARLEPITGKRTASRPSSGPSAPEAETEAYVDLEEDLWGEPRRTADIDDLLRQSGPARRRFGEELLADELKGSADIADLLREGGRRRERLGEEEMEDEPELAQELKGIADIADLVRETRRGERRSGKTEPLTLVVDPMQRGDHPTISEAIAAANPGDRILVRPGLYEEGLVIDKTLEIIGDGGLDEVVVQASRANAVLFKTTWGRVANLTLRQRGDGDWCGVDIAQGRLELEGCDIASESSACVAIHGGADPRLARNRIHDGKAGGVVVFDNGRGVLEDNDIFRNDRPGVVIGEGGNPTLRRNRIHDGNVGGVFVYSGGQGVLEDNDIFGNAMAGVGITGGGNPTLLRNRIHDGDQGGVVAYANGRGVLEDNDIFSNAMAGVGIWEGGNPTLRRNRIHHGKASGVIVYQSGEGVLEDNDIFGNSRTGVAIREGGSPTVRGNRINRNGRSGVQVGEGGRGTFTGNDLRYNAAGAWYILFGSEANLKRAHNLEE